MEKSFYGVITIACITNRLKKWNLDDGAQNDEDGWSVRKMKPNNNLMMMNNKKKEK